MERRNEPVGDGIRSKSLNLAEKNAMRWGFHPIAMAVHVVVLSRMPNFVYAGADKVFGQWSDPVSIAVTG